MMPKTQNALAQYAADTGVLLDAINPEVFTVEDLASNTPVLVVPEAAVKGCKHYRHEKLDKYPAGEHLRWCCDCGAFRHSDSEYWQRPKILKVKK